MITLLLIDVEIALESLHIGDWACVVHFKLKCLDDLLLELHQNALCSCFSILFGEQINHA